MKTDIASMNIQEITEYLAQLSEKSGMKIEKFRAKQIFSWLTKGICSFEEMGNLPSALKKLLEEESYLSLPGIKKKLVSALDGTVKYLFELSDGECVESVFMKYNHGNTLCISTQAGCRMGCSFCASTIGGLARNLTPSEMTGQIIAAEKDTGERISNVVMMGIGEPLDNFDNSMKFLRLVNDKEGLNIGYRHISLSTSGIVPNIYLLAEENFPITLSVSLHSPIQELRESLMPVAKKYKLPDLIQACRDYIAKTGRRISFEYAMINGVNDTVEHAKTLSGLLRGMLAHVNLIPLNEVSEKEFTKSNSENIKKFVSILESAHITVTVRRKLGSDINASCGQLRKTKE